MEHNIFLKKLVSVPKLITNYDVQNKENMYRFYFFIPLIKIWPVFKVNMCKNMKKIGN